MTDEYRFYSLALDRKRKLTQEGVEYWNGRDIMPVLGYSDWHKFEGVVSKAIENGRRSNVDPAYHFCQTEDMVQIGSGAQRARSDWFLTRYACYLIALNAESSKPQVSVAKTYFAIQARRQEISEEEKRLDLRLRILDSNHQLAGAAKSAGVRRYPLFQDAGYRGLYSMGLQSLKNKKGLTDSQELLDHAGELELAANYFRIALTKQRLSRDNIQHEGAAINTHQAVGAEVRASVVRDNGIAPEDLPIEPSIAALVRRRKRISSGNSRLLK